MVFLYQVTHALIGTVYGNFDTLLCSLAKNESMIAMLCVTFALGAGDQPGAVRAELVQRDEQGVRIRLRVWAWQGGGGDLEKGGQKGFHDQRGGLGLKCLPHAQAHYMSCAIVLFVFGPVFLLSRWARGWATFTLNLSFNGEEFLANGGFRYLEASQHPTCRNHRGIIPR